MKFFTCYTRDWTYGVSFGRKVDWIAETAYWVLKFHFGKTGIAVGWRIKKEEGSK
jgi:hypothetical protein